MHELSYEQLLALGKLRDEWRDVALATGPADRPRAERGLILAYEEAGLPPPKTIRWTGSPQEGARLAAVHSEMVMQRSILSNNGGYDYTSALLRLSPSSSQLGPAVTMALWAVYASILRAVESVEPPLLAAMARPYFGSACGGQYDAHLLAHADACEKVLRLAPRFRGLREVARSAGMFWPGANTVIISERPIALYRNGLGSLHRTDGPAMAWPDGFSVYALNGVLVPRRVIMEPDSLELYHVLPQLAPARREIIRLLGVGWLMERARTQGRSRLLDVRGERGLPGEPQDPNFRALHVLLLPDDEPVVALEVRDATPGPDGVHKTYFVRVPPTIEDVDEARAWTWRVPQEMLWRLTQET
jgi:hypothetical protein